MVENEIGVMRDQCLDRRLGECERLSREITASQKQCKAAGARINWGLTTKKVRDKLASAYSSIAKES